MFVILHNKLIIYYLDMSNNKEILNRIQNLRKNLNQYNYEYYGLENPSVSDYEYDMCLKELIQLETQYPEFDSPNSPSKKVGGYISEKFNKVKHEIPMMSLSNAFDEEDLLKFDNDIKKAIGSSDFSYVVEPKIDGLSISVKYKDGNLIQAVTRGDGEIGEDVTQNIKTIKSLPLNIEYDKDLEIRGEVFLTKKDFEKINSDPNLTKKFANARNAASGSLRNLDSNITAKRNLSALFYYVPKATELKIAKQYDVLSWLDKQLIPISREIRHCNNIQGVIERISELTDTRDQFKYDIDGIVIKVNDFNHYEEIGYTSKFPKWAIAYKFPAVVKQTKLNSIDVTVGRTGRINYIANLDEILLEGSQVKKATLHNYDYIKDHEIMLNDIVEIYKAGEIIPKIIRSIKEKRDGSQVVFPEPTNCPSCDSKLVKKEQEVDLYCLNENCVEKQIQQIEYFSSRDAMNIEGLSISIISQLFRNKIINDAIDLYELAHKKEILIATKQKFYRKNDDGTKTEFERSLFKDKSFTNIIEAIEKSKSNSMEKFLTGLGIKYVGLRAAKALSKRFKSIEELAMATREEIEQVPDTGEKMSESLVNWFSDPKNQDLLWRAKKVGINFNYINEFNDVVVKNEHQKYMNKTFVITGSFNKSRNEIKNYIESVFNAKVSDSVSKKTDYLVVGENAGDSKLKKANDLKIEIITEPFWDN
ncbi:NAD-dependent DNA ligase [Malacoplasma penetrans HF-2]|uniref:DNA ligase n=2 Tax=Malacoplasma penetrans TaxID=28227 RepID=DNLJ_MALP2|nr:RecName: Full=DNA ligase; AltName: Full=Polydeoxyribonucleotide synthase [NAD(+)] [Malacoplasma penetrans HF-2]BAC43975.1 NAD-dependent DNA ligase [Malacoplasma penetrans HF-2]